MIKRFVVDASDVCVEHSNRAGCVKLEFDAEIEKVVILLTIEQIVEVFGAKVLLNEIVGYCLGDMEGES